MRTEHRQVLEAHAAAERAAQEPVSASLVIGTLDPADRARLDKAYSRSVPESVCRILDFHVDKGVLGVDDESEERRYSRHDLPKDERKSARQRTLDSVRMAVDDLGRPVLLGDLLDWIQDNGGDIELDREQIQRSVASLIKTEDLEVLQKVRGGGSRGQNLFAPADCDFDDQTIEQAVSTWLEFVLRAFQQVWERREDAAENADRGVRPPNTAAVREEAMALGEYEDKFENPQLLINALRQLAATDHPRIRSIKRPGKKRLLWAPIEVANEDLDLGNAHASDVERITEALKRAERHVGGPVPRSEIQAEIDQDPALRPAGESSVASILSDAAKTTVDDGQGSRVDRVNQAVHLIGTIDNHAHYATDDGDLTRRLFQCKAIKRSWQEDSLSGRVESVEEQMPVPLRLGRLRLMRSELKRYSSQFQNLADEVHANRRGELSELPDLMHECRTLLESVELRLELTPNAEVELPEIPDSSVQGLTSRQVLEEVGELSPALRGVDDPREVVPLLDEVVWRVPNPGHTNRLAGDPDKAAEYLFERTDLMQLAAFRWGGTEAQLQASLSRPALGRLRDWRFVRPLLQDKKADTRLIGVACAGFLGGKELSQILLDLIEHDPDSQLRASALWAYFMADDCEELDVSDLSLQHAAPPVEQMVEALKDATSRADQLRI